LEEHCFIGLRRLKNTLILAYFANFTKPKLILAISVFSQLARFCELRYHLFESEQREKCCGFEIKKIDG
jgi:hypothetical protein